MENVLDLLVLDLFYSCPMVLKIQKTNHEMIQYASFSNI